MSELPKIKIISEEKFTLEINGQKLSGFTRESEWNGLTRFVRGCQSCIVFTGTDLGVLMARMMGCASSPVDGEIVLASPEILPVIQG